LSRASDSPSIRRRLLALLLIPTAAIAALATYSAYRTSLAPFEAAYDQDLLDAALAIASNIEAGRGARPALSLTADAVKVLRSDSQDSIYYRVSGGDGRFIAGDAGLPLPHQRIRNPSFVDAEYGGEPIREANYRVVTPAGAAIVTVAETLHKRAAARQRVLQSALAVDAAQLVTALIVIWFGVRFAIGPLRRVERQLSTRRAGDLEPLTTGGVPVEIRSLIDALNRLLQALRAAEQVERSFIENAAHQLRTPLAGMLAHLELATGEGPPSLPLNTQAVLEGARRLSRTTNQLLSLARSDAANRGAVALEAVYLPGVIEAAVTSRLAAADRAQVEIGAYIEPAETRGVRWLLEEALGNLADNAIAATPPGGSVTIRCGKSASGAFIEVSDTGVGIPPAERHQVFERFYRASNARMTGSGLGLAIVSEVARMHAAKLAISTGADGSGTEVRMTFPPSILFTSPAISG
jgi:two-component system, OmpR family, sensor histidine kinase TctE